MTVDCKTCFSESYCLSVDQQPNAAWTEPVMTVYLSCKEL